MRWLCSCLTETSWFTFHSVISASAGMGNSACRNHRIPEEDLSFLKAQTGLSQKQIYQWYKGFLQDSPDGQLTPEKFSEVYSSFFPAGNPKDLCLQVFRAFDTDQSGRVDFKEFLLGINITSHGTPLEKLEWAFKLYDMDGDDRLVRSEVKHIVRAVYRMLGDTDESVERHAEERSQAIFSKIEHDHDEHITREEFVNNCMKDEELCKFLMPAE